MLIAQRPHTEKCSPLITRIIFLLIQQNILTLCYGIILGTIAIKTEKEKTSLEKVVINGGSFYKLVPLIIGTLNTAAIQTCSKWNLASYFIVGIGLERRKN